MGVTVSEETVRKVQDSWDVVLQIPNCTQVAGELLFRNIFKTAPGAHKMFPFGKGFEKVEDKMFKGRAFKKHAKNVVTMLDTAVHFLGPDLTELEETLVDLGAKHVGYGILPEHYPIVGQALLETLGTALGPDVFTDDLKESWAGVYGFITTSMLKGANESLLRLQVPVYGSKKTITLDEYVSGMLPGQTELYYITMSTEANSSFSDMDKLQEVKKLQKAGVVILHIHKNKQGLLATNLQKYLGRKMVDVAVEQQLDTSFLKRNKKKNGPPTSISVTTLYEKEGLNEEDALEFCQWFQYTLGRELVEVCTPTCDFASQAARVIKDEQEVRHLEDYKLLQGNGNNAGKHVEINPNHPLVVEIHAARHSQPVIAKLLAAQIYDNCLTQAGMLQDFRIMVNRINDISMMLLQEKRKSGGGTPTEDEEEEQSAIEGEKKKAADDHSSTDENSTDENSERPEDDDESDAGSDDAASDAASGTEDDSVAGTFDDGSVDTGMLEIESINSDFS